MPALKPKQSFRRVADIANIPFERTGLMIHGMWRLRPMSKNDLYAGYQHWCEKNKHYNPSDTRARLYEHTEAFLKNRKKSPDDEIKPYDHVRLLKRAFTERDYGKTGAQSYMADEWRAREALRVLQFIQKALETGRLKNDLRRQNCLDRFHRDRKNAIGPAAQTETVNPALRGPL